MLDINSYIKDNKLKIIVKPNAKKTEIIGFDDARQALRVNIKSAPEKGKANLEVIKFFSKILSKKVIIDSGLSSKSKILIIC